VDFTITQHNNTVGHANCRKPVRNQDGNPTLGQLRESAKYFIFGHGVQSCGRFVENQNAGVSEISAGQREFLSFPAGEIRSILKALTQHLVKTVRQ
jgi:hypothetical protein